MSEPSVADLTAFRRDILWTLANCGASKGTAILSHLEDYYGEDLSHGRLYPNLDELANKGLIEKGERDRRTNEYQLTDAARDALAARARWQDTPEVPV